MDTNPNILFDDWEAEQMQDPEFRAKAEELHQKLTDLGEAIAKALEPAFRRVTGAICSFMIQLCRVQMYADLTQRWRIPHRLAHWLSAKWPERWLPELRFSD